MSEEETNKLVEIQMLYQQIQQLQSKVQMVEQQMIEAASTQQALDEFSKSKVGSEVLMPVTNGIFAKAELTENKTLRINVGAGVVVEKTPEEGIRMIGSQIENLQRAHETLVGNLQKMAEKLNSLQKEA